PAVGSRRGEVLQSNRRGKGGWAARVGVLAAVTFVACCALAGAAAAAPLPLGTLTLNSETDPNCPAGSTCQGFQVTCPGVQLQADGFLATAPATSSSRAVVVLASGGGGGGWWAGSMLPTQFIADLRADGFTVVQLRWADRWLRAASGEDAGSAHLACRPATAYSWVHDNVYVPLGIDDPHRVGRCGFCISGNSGGASQSSYALSHYGLDQILDAVVPTSGPPHAAQAKGCLRNAGEEAYWYSASNMSTIDSSYGFVSTSGPCALHDPVWVPRWDEESVDTQGSDYFHDRTRAHVILGGNDNGSSPAHARDYVARLEAEGTPYLTSELVPSMPHGIQASADGLAALGVALRHQGFESPYPRPKAASPVRISLVPAYDSCTAPNREHGPPLAFGSCAPPGQASGFLTVGTAAANGQAPNSVGHVRVRVVVGDPSTSADEADLALEISITDVREAGTLADYAGELELDAVVRLTDRSNGPASDEPATVTDFAFTLPVSCTTTPDPDAGATCAVSTTADAVIPGVAVEGRRAIWELGAVEVFDGGPDGDVDTPGNTLFAHQGLFVP
ncbi:MAG: hypothetical protein ACRDLQ_03515, partial [Solirubrobacterales bacterium]